MAQCLWKEVALWEKISSNPAFALLSLAPRYRYATQSPFAKMPQDGTRLNEIGSVPMADLTAATAGVYVLAHSYLVPPGSDGVINNTLNKFVPQPGGGQAFQDGSGQLTWVLGINNYLAYGYTNITTQMGDVGQLGPTATGGGIRIKSNDLIQFYVAASANGIATLDPNGIVVCAFQGWLYANR